TNAQVITGGSWLSYDASVDTQSLLPPLLPPHALLEFGLGIGSFLDANPSFSTVQVRTAADVASATTDAGAPSPADDFLVSTLPALPNCPTNLGSCTANDLVSTVVALSIVGSDACNMPSDTLTINLTTEYSSTANNRYDLGLFVSTNGG